MKVAAEQRKKDFRTIFELWHESPQMKIQEIVNSLGLNWRTVRSRIDEALDNEYIVGPCLKKKSFENLGEKMYFIKCENPEKTDITFREDDNIVYHARLDGFCNLWTMSKDKIAVDGDVLAGGLPTDYYVSFPPNWTWGMGFNSIRTKVETFNLNTYTPKHILTNHWDKTVEWTELDEILYREFKYNFRKPLLTVREKHKIWWGDIYDWLEKVPECCQILTYYYPASISAYDQYMFMIETDYEDFIIELFSQFPTSTVFFKIKDILFSYMHIDRQYLRNPESGTDNLSQMNISSIMEDLLEKNIIKNVSRAYIAYCWRKSL